MKTIVTHHVSGAPMAALLLTLAAVTPQACSAQTNQSLDAKGKLRFHAVTAVGPMALLGAAAYAGFLQEADTPTKWGQGGVGYGRRFGSTVAYNIMRNTLAFGLDSTLHQDPRYFRAGGTGFWRRTRHALHGTIFSRKDGGGETLSTWRIGSAYSAAFLSNQWYPAKLNTVRLGFAEGTLQLGFDLAGNIGSEFWPDIKKKIFRK